MEKTTVVASSHFIHLARSTARSQFPEAYAAWDAKHADASSHVAGSSDDWDDDSSLATFDDGLYGLTNTVDYNTNIFRWSDRGWSLWASDAEVTEDDSDNPETPQQQSYYRIPAE